MLIRRNAHDPTDLRSFLVFARRADMTVANVCRVVGVRWQIECGFEAAKGECGLDDYEVRTWDAWHRHITLALLGTRLSHRHALPNDGHHCRRCR